MTAYQGVMHWLSVHPTAVCFGPLVAGCLLMAALTVAAAVLLAGEAGTVGGGRDG